jgi:hypothetical protein
MEYVVEDFSTLENGAVEMPAVDLTSWIDRTKCVDHLLHFGEQIPYSADKFSTTSIDDVGWTPLHFAADSGIIDIIEQLLNAGADPFITPMKVAAAGKRKLAESLGVIISKAFHPSNDTPRDVARKSGHHSGELKQAVMKFLEKAESERLDAHVKYIDKEWGMGDETQTSAPSKKSTKKKKKKGAVSQATHEENDTNKGISAHEEKITSDVIEKCDSKITSQVSSSSQKTSDDQSDQPSNVSPNDAPVKSKVPESLQGPVLNVKKVGHASSKNTKEQQTWQQRKLNAEPTQRSADKSEALKSVNQAQQSRKKKAKSDGNQSSLDSLVLDDLLPAQLVKFAETRRQIPLELVPKAEERVTLHVDSESETDTDNDSDRDGNGITRPEVHNERQDAKDVSSTKNMQPEEPEKVQRQDDFQTQDTQHVQEKCDKIPSQEIAQSSNDLEPECSSEPVPQEPLSHETMILSMRQEPINQLTAGVVEPTEDLPIPVQHSYASAMNIPGENKCLIESVPPQSRLKSVWATESEIPTVRTPIKYPEQPLPRLPEWDRQVFEGTDFEPDYEELKYLERAKLKMLEDHWDAAATKVECRHVLGLDIEELSFGQLDTLEEVHRAHMKRINDARIKLARKEERALIREDLRIAKDWDDINLVLRQL